MAVGTVFAGAATGHKCARARYQYTDGRQTTSTRAGAHVRTARTGIAAATVLLVLSGCASAEDVAASDDPSADSSSEPTDEPTDDPTEEVEPEKPSTPTPDVGDCHRLESNQVTSGVVQSGNSTVQCGKPHNTQTFSVTNAKGATRKALKQGDLNKVHSQTEDTCRKKLGSWVGGGKARLARTGYGVIIGTAPAEDVALGATWVRCDVVLYDISGSPVKLPKKTRGSLKKQTSDVDYCVKGTFKASGTNVVLCSKPHNFRSVGVVKFGGPSASFPGTKKVQRTMRKRCFVQTRKFLGKNRYTAWTLVTKETWSAGDRFGECYAKTKK